MRIEILKGNITDHGYQPGWAIVNAANPTLLGGGGVDGVINRAAGRDLYRYCSQLPANSDGARCPVGHAVWTPGFNLEPTSIIHTVGPIFPTGRPPSFPGEFVAQGKAANRLLADCVRHVLEVADQQGVNSLAIPAISCGFYGCQPAVFASIAKKVLAETVTNVTTIVFVLYTDNEYAAFQIGWDCCEAVVGEAALLREILGVYCALETPGIPTLELTIRLEELFNKLGRRVTAEEAWELTKDE